MPAALADLIDELARRAALRARHRVPRRAHVLAAPRARAGRVAGGHRARSIRSPSTSTPFGEILGGPGLMVAHAAEQDLAILERACGRVPTQLFDTQVAAGFIGHGRAVARVARRAAARRPAHQGRPAHRLDAPAADASSSASTPPPTSSTCSRCTTCSSTGSNRWAGSTWATDECEERRLRVRTRPEPEVAWWRIKGARQLRGKSRGVAQQVGAWRERTAAAPRRAAALRALGPRARSASCSRPPRTREELTAIRGVDGRSPARRRGRRAARRGHGRPRARPGVGARCPSRTTSTARSRRPSR